MITKDAINNQDVCSKLAKKYNLPESTIIKIVSSQFKLLANNIKEGKDTRIQHIGTFRKNPKVKRKDIKHLQDEKLLN